MSTERRPRQARATETSRRAQKVSSTAEKVAVSRSKKGVSRSGNVVTGLRPVRESVREGARGAYREAILAAAERVFARAGFYDTRMADIAKEAGVGVGTLYNYFESKEVIFADLFAFRNEEFKAAIRAFAVAADPIERLRQIVGKTLSVLEENGDLCSIFLERGAIGEYDMERLAGAEVGRDYEEFLEYLEETIRDAVRAKKLRADVEPRLLVTTISGAMNAALYTWLKRGRRGRVSDVADTLCSLFLEGAKSQ